MIKKKLVRSLIAFFVLPFILFVLLFLFPLNKQFAYHFIKSDCENRSIWIYDRMARNNTPVDIALLGSSHIKNAVVESIVEDNLSEKSIRLHVADLGYCRFGTNMEYVILKDLLRNKKVRYLILEVRDEEERLSHIDFGYVADAKDVWAAPLFVNQYYFRDIFKSFSIRLEYWRRKLLFPQVQFDINTNEHGYAISPETASEKELDDAVIRKAYEAAHPPSSLERWINNRYPLKYLDKLLELSRQHHCQLFFLYLPGYAAQKLPGQYEIYNQNGTLLIPPDSILSDRLNWRDDNHLNGRGAGKISGWLAGALATHLTTH